MVHLPISINMQYCSIMNKCKCFEIMGNVKYFNVQCCDIVKQMLYFVIEQSMSYIKTNKYKND